MLTMDIAQTVIAHIQPLLYVVLRLQEEASAGLRVCIDCPVGRHAPSFRLPDMRCWSDVQSLVADGYMQIDVQPKVPHLIVVNGLPGADPMNPRPSVVPILILAPPRHGLRQHLVFVFLGPLQTLTDFQFTLLRDDIMACHQAPTDPNENFAKAIMHLDDAYLVLSIDDAQMKTDADRPEDAEVPNSPRNAKMTREEKTRDRLRRKLARRATPTGSN